MAQGNLLQNGTLSEDFAPFRNQDNLITAASWAPWWLPQAEHDPQWARQRPTFGPFTPEDGAVQMVSTPWGTHVGGLYQQVPSAVGNRYELSVEGQAWSSESEEPGSRQQSSDPNLQIGIDPTGGLDPTSPLVVWSEQSQPLSKWETLRLAAKSQAATNTVYLRSAPSLPKRQQAIFWRNALLRGVGRYRRSTSIVGTGDTHITLVPENPPPGSRVTARISANRNHAYSGLTVERPDAEMAAVVFQGMVQEEDRFVWRYEFTLGETGLYDIRFVADRGAQLLAQRLVRAADQTQLVPSGLPRLDYMRVYVLLPPTADEKWLVAAAKGSFDRRFTVGFSADDAGVGELGNRYVLAVNPHHWPEVLTADWFRHYYPGTKFKAVVANSPADLEAWLHNWEPET